MKILNEYPGSHYYWTEYTQEKSLYCPHCGQQGTLWTESGGDYYQGPSSLCTHCSHRFYLHDGGFLNTEPNVLKILDQLKTGLTAQPTTRAGR